MSKRLTYEELEQRVRELEASKTLREQSSLDRLIESIQAGVVVHGSDGGVIKSNTAAQIMLGLTHEQMLGKELIDPAWTFLREDGNPMPVEEFPVSQVIATKKPVHKLVGIQRSDNAEPIWVLDTAIPEFDENGHINQIITTFMDISALKKSEEKYRNLFENTMHEVHLWKLVRDEHGSIKTWRLVEINSAALKAWGKTRPEIFGKTANEIFSYDATEHFMPIVKKIFSEGTPYTWETYFPPTGQFLFMTSVPFGEYFMSTGIDITDRKKTEDALKESEERHRLFYNPSFGGSIIHDKSRILDCSCGITNITGYSHNELIGMDGLLLIAPDWRDFVMDKITSEFDEPYEAESIRKDGTIFPSRLHATTIQYHGKPARLVEFRDITDIKKAEQALRESESLLRNIIDSSTDYIFVKDKNLKTILCNQKFAQAVNKKPSDLIGKTDIENGWNAELVKGNPEKGIIGYEKDDLEALSGKIVQNTDRATISDKTLFFDSVKIPLIDENNEIFGVLGISRDITEKKKAEQALKASEKRLRTFVDTSPFPIVVTDAEHEKILYWSKSAQELFGHQPKTAAEWFSHAYPDPQYRQAVVDRSKPYLERAQHSKTAVNTGEYQIVCRDGSVKICEIYAQFIPGHLVLTNNDITERKKAEEALNNSIIDLKLAQNIAKASEQKYRNIAESMPGLILKYKLNPDGSDQLLYISKGVEDLYEVQREDAVKNNTLLWDRIHRDDLEEFITSIKKSAENLSFWELEHRLTMPDGRVKWVRTRGVPNKQEDGSVVWDSLAVDITERKRTENALRQSEQQLQELNAQKDKFFSILAHDLKNPLTGFLSFANILERDFDRMTSAEQASLIALFRASAEMLFALLDNLLTWARLQNGHIKSMPDHFSLDQLVDRAVALVTPNAAQKRITLTSTMTPVDVYADISMTGTVVRNLLANAIKFTPNDGTVTITATHTSHDVCVTVADTGIGIAPAKLPQLFRIDGKTQRAGTGGEKGTGLGLILCKEFMETQGGKIWVESEPGNGTRVMFTLPLKPDDRG